MESMFFVIWIIVLVICGQKTDSTIDDIMYKVEEESKTSMDYLFSYPSDKVDGRSEQVVRFQYDMLLHKKEYYDLMGHDTRLPLHRSRRVATINHDRLWTNGRVPYTIDDSFNATEQLCIEKALSMWMRWTCLNFVPAIDYEHNKIKFVTTTRTCGQSYVGMMEGEQNIYISHKCSTNLRVVAHEIGHAIGLYHEHMRHDSGDYVILHNDNIENTEDARDNFRLMKENSYNNFSKPYDYLSIMHYGKLFLSRNKTANLLTLVPKNESYLDIIGEVKTVSYYDAKIVCQLYKCSGHCKSTCSGNGFMGKNCQCMCRGPSDDNPIKLCGEFCSMPAVDESKYVVYYQNIDKTLPKNSGPFYNGTTFEIVWNDTDTCGQGFTKYHCQHGEWIGDLPECQQDCVLKTMQYNICEDNTTITAPVYDENIEYCTVFDSYQHGENCTVCDSYEHGENITLSCKSDKTMMVTSQCNNGSWTTFSLNCPKANHIPSGAIRFALAMSDPDPTTDPMPMQDAQFDPAQSLAKKLTRPKTPKTIKISYPLMVKFKQSMFQRKLCFNMSLDSLDTDPGNYWFYRDTGDSIMITIENIVVGKLRRQGGIASVKVVQNNTTRIIEGASGPSKHRVFRLKLNDITVMVKKRNDGYLHIFVRPKREMSLPSGISGIIADILHKQIQRIKINKMQTNSKMKATLVLNKTGQRCPLQTRTLSLGSYISARSQCWSFTKNEDMFYKIEDHKV